MDEFKNDLFEAAASPTNKDNRKNQHQQLKFKLSPSSLNLYLDCPRCFWLYLNKNIKRPSIPVATITTGLDRVIKEYLEPYRLKNILPPLLENKVPGKLIRNLPYKGWLEFIDSKIDARLGGYLDECLDLGNNFYAALDHKTRGTKPAATHKAHQFQMDVYTFLLEQNDLPTKRVAYLVYYIPKSVTEEKTFEFDVIAHEVKTEPERARDVCGAAVSMLKESIPAADKDCEFCKWTATQDIE
jgi:hypothetical protein